MSEPVADFRSDRMPSPEGKGKARRAWDAYVAGVGWATAPAVKPLARKLGVLTTLDLVGFWVAWHLEGGFEGLQRMGMSRASIYRRISIFRKAFGAHPDEFELPGVSLDIAAYQAGKATEKSQS